MRIFAVASHTGVDRNVKKMISTNEIKQKKDKRIFLLNITYKI